MSDFQINSLNFAQNLRMQEYSFNYPDANKQNNLYVLLRIADRILVLCEGRLTGSFCEPKPPRKN